MSAIYDAEERDVEADERLRVHEWATEHQNPLTAALQRAVDRYGAADSGEQYRGYRQIASTASTTRHGALERLAEIAGTSALGLTTQEITRRAHRAAHPDRGGSAELWHEVQELVAALAGGDR